MRQATLLALLVLGALLILPAVAGAKKGGDRNHDGLPDRWEMRYGLSLKTNQAGRDPDHDGLRNRGELRAGTDPRDADTDDDGIKDGAEHSGRVLKFRRDMLFVRLDTGGVLRARVTGETTVLCPTTEEDLGEPEEPDVLEDLATEHARGELEAASTDADAAGEGTPDPGPAEAAEVDEEDAPWADDGEQADEERADGDDLTASLASHHPVDADEVERTDDSDDAACSSEGFSKGVVIAEATLRRDADGSRTFTVIELAE